MTNIMLIDSVLETREASRRLARELELMKASVGLSGLSYTQGHILLHLDANGLLTMVELAEMLQLDKSTTCRALAPLFEQKLIGQREHQTDKRQKPVALTEKGKKLASKIHESANINVEAAIESLSEEDRQRIIDGMHLYAKALYRARQKRDYEIREIRPADNGYVARIIQKVMGEFRLNVPGSSLHDREVTSMYECYQGERAVYFVATKDGEIVGGAGVSRLDGGDQDTCELKKMYILPEARGIGLGETLLEWCLDAARARNFRRCYLETIREMSQAKTLYEKFGFKSLPTRLGETGHFRCDSWFALEL